MTDGEMTILVTALIGFGGTLVSQWAAAQKANRAAQDIIDLREQDRLDREQAAKEVIRKQEKASEAQLIELEIIKAKSAEADAAVRRQILVSSRLARMQHAKVIGALDDNKQRLEENTALTEQAARRADEAFHEANTVNQKIIRLGDETAAEKAIAMEQRNRIEENIADTKTKVDETIAKVEDVRAILNSDDTREMPSRSWPKS